MSNRTLFYQRQGQGAIKLILLHGWGFQHQVWDALAATLAPHCQTYAVDLPGYGCSPALADASLATLADTLAEQLPTGVWLGWSLGGLLALTVALRHPDKVRGLYLVSSTPRFVQADDWLQAQPLTTWERFASQLQTDWHTTLQRFLALQVKGDAQAQHLLRELRQAFPPDAAPSTEVLAQGLNLLRNTDLRSELAQVRCPTCLVLGARDALVPVGVAQDWQRLWSPSIPLQLKLFPNAAHMPFASQLAAFADYLYHWLHEHNRHFSTD